MPRLALLLIVSTSVLASACEPETALEGNGDKQDATGELADELAEKYGLAPNNYPFLFNRSNEAENIFSDTLTASVTMLNEIAANQGYDFTVNEGALGINFISEGGILPLKADRIRGIDGFGEVGIDTLVSNYVALKPWLDPTIAAEIEGCDLAIAPTCNSCEASAVCEADYNACTDPTPNNDVAECEEAFNTCLDNFICPSDLPPCIACSRIIGNENERGEYFYTMTNLTLEEAVMANASMYAYSKAAVERDYTQIGLSLKDAPAEEQFFWATMYFNAGAGTAGNRFDEHGTDYYQDKWPEGKEANWRNPLYNALWRTSSYEYVMVKVFGGLKR